MFFVMWDCSFRFLSNIKRDLKIRSRITFDPFWYANDKKKITKSVLKCSELVNNDEKLRNYFGEKRLH